jgi:hypothetical protein
LTLVFTQVVDRLLTLAVTEQSVGSVVQQCFREHHRTLASGFHQQRRAGIDAA